MYEYFGESYPVRQPFGPCQALSPPSAANSKLPAVSKGGFDDQHVTMATQAPVGKILNVWKQTAFDPHEIKIWFIFKVIVMNFEGFPHRSLC